MSLLLTIAAARDAWDEFSTDLLDFQTLVVQNEWRLGQSGLVTQIRDILKSWDIRGASAQRILELLPRISASDFMAMTAAWLDRGTIPARFVILESEGQLMVPPSMRDRFGPEAASGRDLFVGYCLERTLPQFPQRRRRRVVSSRN